MSVFKDIPRECNERPRPDRRQRFQRWDRLGIPTETHTRSVFTDLVSCSVINQYDIDSD